MRKLSRRRALLGVVSLLVAGVSKAVPTAAAPALVVVAADVQADGLALKWNAWRASNSFVVATQPQLG